MSNEIPDANLNWYVCDEGHIHLTFTDEDGKEMFGVAIEISEWLDMADAIDEEIEVMIATEESEHEVKH